MRYIQYHFNKEKLKKYFRCDTCFLSLRFDDIYEGHEVLSHEDAMFANLSNELVLSDKEIDVARRFFNSPKTTYRKIGPIEKHMHEENYYYSQHMFRILEYLKYVGLGIVESVNDDELTAVFNKIHGIFGSWNIFE